jgi:hypothetical protein
LKQKTNDNECFVLLAQCLAWNWTHCRLRHNCSSECDAEAAATKTETAANGNSMRKTLQAYRCFDAEPTRDASYK